MRFGLGSESGSILRLGSELFCKTACADSATAETPQLIAKPNNATLYDVYAGIAKTSPLINSGV